MTKIDYSYQTIAAEKVLENALNTNYLASVLAACPSSGKTTISHIIINKYLQIFPEAKIVVLTEGQNTLKNQYLSELENSNVKINFTYGLFGSDAQVQVGLPQSIDKLNLTSFSLLLIDECHNYYMQQMEQFILKTYKPTHQILMTGSPTKFNFHNATQNKKYGIYYIAANYLQEQGVFSAADLDVVKVYYKKNAVQTIKEMMTAAETRGANLTKLMIACPTIAYAKQVASYLMENERQVSLSTSENDSEDTEIQRFKKGETDTLIVVGKGILGFNEKTITTLFDMKSSVNVDTSYQLFARILRVHPEEITKTYFRISEKKDHVKQVAMLYKMMALMDEKTFKGFTGDNLKCEMY